MTAASSIVKTPQIRNMLKAKSSAGLSPVAVYLETFMYLCSVAYFMLKDYRADGNISEFSDYGENVFLALQNFVMIVLMWRYTESSVSHIAAGMASLVAFWAVAIALPAEHQYILIWLPAPLMLASRLPQIVQNFRDGHTGILSIVTLGMNSLGSAMRIFTTLVDASGVDSSALVTYVLSFGCNATMALQCVAYHKKTHEVLSKKKN